MRAARKVIVGLFVFLTTGAPIYCQEHDSSYSWAPWTHCYTFFADGLCPESADLIDTKISETSLVVSNNSAAKPIPFTQLIFSWNALRPAQGFFRFSVRTKDCVTKKWSTWHKMAEWGNDKQLSFSDKKPGVGSGYNFAHLDLAQCAGIFEIKIDALDGSVLKDIKMISVCVSRLKDMGIEGVNHAGDGLRSIIIRGIPHQSQMVLDHPDSRIVCSPTSTSMLVAYLLQQRVSAHQFADMSYDYGLKAYGSWAFNTAHAFELCENKFFFSVMRLSSFASLYQLLCEQIPVVVSVRGKLKNAPQAYPAGHLLLVVGYDARRKNVICHDPAQPNNAKVLTRYSLGDFLKAWDHSYRLAYIARKREG